MNSHFSIRALSALKERSERIHQLYKLKVNLIDFDEGITDKLEESVAIILSKGNEKNYEFILSYVSWWLYEKVDKIITLKDGKKVDVNNVKDFVEWIENYYD